MWVLSFFHENALATTLNSGICAVTHIEPIVASVYTIDPNTKKKNLCFYPQVVSYLLKKIASDQTFVKMGFALLCFALAANTTLMQYADDLYPKSCKVADVNDKST